MYFKGYSLFSGLLLTSPAGTPVQLVCVKLVSLNANDMSSGGNFVVLSKETLQSCDESLHREFSGILDFG